MTVATLPQARDYLTSPAPIADWQWLDDQGRVVAAPRPGGMLRLKKRIGQGWRHARIAVCDLADLLDVLPPEIAEASR